MSETAETSPAASQNPEGFGPFSPPSDYRFEPEFEATVPRPVPRALRAGSYESRWRQAVQVAWGIALVLIVSSYIEPFKKVGYYVAPFMYLQWAGLAAIAVASAILVYHLVRPCKYTYVRDGRPLIIRVLETKRVVTAVSVSFESLVEYQHPETGKVLRGTVRSPRVWTLWGGRRYGTTIEPGQYCTAVFLPGYFERSFQIYGYLGLNPDADFIRKKGKSLAESANLAQLLMIVGAACAVLALMTAVLYAFMFRVPIRGAWLGWLAGILLGAVPAGAIGMRILRGRGRAGAAVSGIAAIAGLVIVTAFAFILNAVLDRSQPQMREIEVVKLRAIAGYMTRKVDVAYRELDSNDVGCFRVDTERLGKFMMTGAGAAEVRAGQFGWDWVRQVHPVVLVSVQVRDPNAPQAAASALKQGYGLVIVTDQKQAIQPSRRLQEIAMRHMQQAAAAADPNRAPAATIGR